MIVELLSGGIISFLKAIFSWVSLPQMPEEALNAFNTYFSYVFDNLNFLNFFLNVSTLKTVASIAILIYTFEHIYKIMIWVIHKLPLSID